MPRPLAGPRGVHGLDLGVARLELLQGADGEQEAGLPVAEEGDRGVQQPVDGERVHVLGTRLRVREREMASEQFLDVGGAGIVCCDQPGQR